MGNNPACLIDPTGNWAEPDWYSYKDDDGDDHYHWKEGHDKNIEYNGHKWHNIGETVEVTTENGLVFEGDAKGNGTYSVTECAIKGELGKELETSEGIDAVQWISIYIAEPFNEAFNPLHYVWEGIYGLSTGKNYVNGQPLSTSQSVASLGFAAIALYPGGGEIAVLEKATGKYLVYQGYDLATGKVKYVGMTGRNPLIRFGEHARSGSAKAFLQYEVVSGASNLSKIEAIILEQNLINSSGIDNLYNVRNSIAPKYWSKYGIKP